MTIETTIKGDRLIITADDESRAELAANYDVETYGEGGGYMRAESDVAEELRDEWELMRVDDVPGWHLTDAPFIAESDGVNVPDNGNITLWEGTAIFYFDDYMLTDPWRQLAETGRCEWQRLEWTGYDAPLDPRFIESHFTGGEREGKVLWIGESAFADFDYERTAKAWPELRGSDYDDRITPGLYFWRHGERYGPYGNGCAGIMQAEADGGVFASNEPDPGQRELPIAA